LLKPRSFSKKSPRDGAEATDVPLTLSGAAVKAPSAKVSHPSIRKHSANSKHKSVSLLLKPHAFSKSPRDGTEASNTPLTTSGVAIKAPSAKVSHPQSISKRNHQISPSLNPHAFSKKSPREGAETSDVPSLRLSGAAIKAPSAKVSHPHIRNQANSCNQQSSLLLLKPHSRRARARGQKRATCRRG
jgi:hypothetical protein